MTIYFICKKWLNTDIFSRKTLIYGSLFILIGAFLFPTVAFLSDVTAENILKETNQERIMRGKTPLTHNHLLEKAAAEKAKSIFQSQKFQHDFDGKKFSSWVKDAGYNYTYVGENLALDFVTSESMLTAWLDSATHKKNLLNERFSEIGIAVVDGTLDGRQTILVVQIFAVPLAE
jgi:uncharacterized protein YkwD